MEIKIKKIKNNEKIKNNDKKQIIIVKIHRKIKNKDKNNELKIQIKILTSNNELFITMRKYIFKKRVKKNSNKYI